MRNRPSNLKYTDLCMYIDSVLYERDSDNNPISQRQLNEKEIDNVYTYLYHITYALAVKKKLFTNSRDYDNFCLEAAAKFFQRLTKTGQDFDPESKNANKAIKSVLNYIKGAIGFMAISYRQENYSEFLNPDHNSEEELAGAQAWIENQAKSQYTEQVREEITSSFEYLPKYIEKVCSSSIYRHNPVAKNNLSLSIYLSLLNCLTLENKYRNKSIMKKQLLVLKQLENKINSVVIWSENKNITPQIVDLFIKKSFKALEEDINSIKQAYNLDEDMLEDIAKSALPGYGLSQSED